MFHRRILLHTMNMFYKKLLRNGILVFVLMICALVVLLVLKVQVEQVSIGRTVRQCGITSQKSHSFFNFVNYVIYQFAEVVLERLYPKLTMADITEEMKSKQYCIEQNCRSIEELHTIWLSPEVGKAWTCIENRKEFQSKFSLAELYILLDLIEVFIDTVKSINATYFLFGGSCLGSVRHGGFIPWDDDFDIIVDNNKRDELITALKQLDLPYVIGDEDNNRFKFYSTKCKLLKFIIPKIINKWRWPFVDVFFYVINDGILTQTDTTFDISYNVKDIFPLKLAPYMNQEMPVPRKAENIVADMFVCETLEFSHVYHLFLPVEKIMSISCTYLYDTYPFVHTIHFINGTVHRTIRKGNTIIHSQYIYI